METQEHVDALIKKGWVPLMWHITDVADNYEVTEDQAVDVIKSIEHDEFLIQTIYELIDSVCKKRNYKQREDQ